MRLMWLALAACAVGEAHAEFPYPSNPDPCDARASDCIAAGEFSSYLFLPVEDPPVLPDDFGSDNWKLTSGTTGDPVLDSSAQELFGVRGASVDLAWQMTTGRPDVLIAVLDSGIRWQDSVPDLVNKFHLNRGELPIPQGSDNPADPYDRNGDGVFNVADYLASDGVAADGRVEDRNGNGMIDPEDLIFIFSDSVDDDGNGYVDDISGWDFFEDDNNALDEVRFGHGTGESKDSSAEANNGVGDVGACPNCMLLEVRVGDSFVADANAFAQGVVFGVDSGASVIQEALGSLNETEHGQLAVDYAYDNGVVVMASAADEESNHHNYPANYNHTVQVNSVRRFEEISGIVQSPASYLYLNGCTNYGGHIAFSVPSSSCSSEATGKGSGMAGLVVSAALNAIDRGLATPYRRDDGSLAPFPMSAEEVKQVLSLSTDDIDFAARPADGLEENYSTEIGIPGIAGSERFRSVAGWDQYFGYGRVNADRAVQWVDSGRIPPEASIDGPDWYGTVDPEVTTSLAVVGRAAANRAASCRYEVAVAPGIQPLEEQFEAVISDADCTSSVDGELATIDVGVLRARMPHGVEGPALSATGEPDPDRFSFTIRLRATDDRGLSGEDRRVAALHHDPDLVDGFPVPLGSDGVSGPATADIDGDGREEIIVATGNGLVHVMRSDGSELPGWPVATDPLETHDGSAGFASGAVRFANTAAILGAVVVGDIDRDGTLEIGAADLLGRVYVWNHLGQRRPGFPVTTLPEYSHSHRSERDLSTDAGRLPDLTNRHDRDNRVGRAITAGPILGNLDGSADGSLEILAGSYDRHIYAWHADGSPVRGWPVLLKDPEKVASVDPATDEVTLVEDSGARMGTKVLVPPSLGDLDGDGSLEVVAVVNEEYREDLNAVFTNPIVRLFQSAGVLDGGNTRMYVLHGDGAAHGEAGVERGWNPEAFVAGFPVRTALLTTELLPVVGTGTNGPPALADIDGDGSLEIVTMSAVGPAYVFDGAGNSFFGKEDSGEDVALPSEPFGPQSDSTDAPAFGALGASMVAEFGGVGQGFYVLAPVAGLGKLIDNQAAASQFPADNQLAAWRVSGAGGAAVDPAFAPAFPRRVNDLQFIAGPAVADITGDGLPEAIEGSSVYDVHAFDVNGREAAGWPKFTNGWMVGTSAVGDVDGDGLLEVVAVTREGNLFVWDTDGGECGAVLWRRYHHDEWGTGNYHADTRPPASLRPQDVRVASVAVADATVEIELDRVPGDDLYCGEAVMEVRFADQPIETVADFDAAELAEIEESPPPGRDPGTLIVRSEAWRQRRVYLALAARDDAGNRSAVTTLEAVDMRDAGGDDGCAVAPASGGAGAGWGLIALALGGAILRRRNGRRVRPMLRSR